MRSNRPAAKVSTAVIATAVALILTSCFSFEQGGMMYFELGYRSGTTTIKRHASRDVAYYAAGAPTHYKKGEEAAGILKGATKDISMPGFIRDRWNASLAPDQYVDIGEDILTLAWEQRCLAMRAKLGWGDVGYSWFTYGWGEAGCNWGVDPVPSVP